jgi:hypothetical protein
MTCTWNGPQPQAELDFTQRRPPEVREKIEDGMKRADDHADVRWKHLLDACIVAAARKKAEITIDDVLDEFDAIPEANRPDTHNWSALGPAMRRAWKMGVLKPTDRVARSRRPHKHGNRGNIWLSQYYGSQQ